METKIKKFLTPSGSLLPQPKPGSSEKEWNKWANEAFWSPEINTEVEYPKRRKIADEAISKIRTRSVLNPNYTYIMPDNELDELVVTAQAPNKAKTFFIDPNNWTSEYNLQHEWEEYKRKYGHYPSNIITYNPVKAFPIELAALRNASFYGGLITPILGGVAGGAIMLEIGVVDDVASGLNQGYKYIAPKIIKGLNYVNKIFLPSKWLNPVTGNKLLTNTAGVIADGAVDATFAGLSANELYKGYKQDNITLDHVTNAVLDLLPVGMNKIDNLSKGITSMIDEGSNFSKSIASLLYRKGKNSVNVLNNIDNLPVSKELADLYKSSYFVTNPQNVNSVIHYKLDPIYGYVPSMPGKTLTNKMSPSEIFKIGDLSSKINPENTYLKLVERPSKLTEAERLGIPKGERFNLGDFKSELNWNLKDWMGKNIPEQPGKQPYTIEDVMSLQSHIPEYLRIEKMLKSLGLYKPPKHLDPRSYIQLQSKNAKYLNLNPIFSGVQTQEISPTYNDIFWGTYAKEKIGTGNISPYLARAYASDDAHVLQLTVPKDTKTFNFNAEGLSWFDLKNIGRTNDLVDVKFKNGFDRVNINNVIDPGKNSGSIRSKTKYKVFDNPIDEFLYMTLLPLNDVIINKGVPRKSIIGNNGNFYSDDLNMYHKQGGSIHIKEKNKGKFTESAKRAGKSVQEHARDVVKNPKATKLQKKRALFALNAKKFKHD